jgi:uncharacterized protein (TIGR03083 family)
MTATSAEPLHTVPSIAASSIPPISSQEAANLEQVELERVIALLRSLTPAEWNAPTRTAGRDVQGVASHIAGTYAAQGNFRQLSRQLSPRVHQFYQSPGQTFQETITRVQVGDRLYRRPDEIIAEIETAGERAIRLRSILLRPLFRVSAGTITLPGRLSRTWSAQSPLLDLWLHRLEISDATGRTFEVTDDHDRRLFESSLRRSSSLLTKSTDEKRIELEIGRLAGARYVFGQSDETHGTIVIPAETLARLIAGVHSPAAARERSTPDGDIKAVMAILTAIHRN